MTVIRPNSIAGITSITAQGENISFYSSDGVNISQFNANINATSGVSTIANLTVGFITATTASISGNVNVGGNVSIAGTLTYEDVTNVDSIGLVTARSGVIINSGGLRVTGVTTVSTGSTSAPSISPSGDNNTGVFFPSADTIAFAEGGVESARFDSSGRLGIGTNLPVGQLEVFAGLPGLRDLSNALRVSTNASGTEVGRGTGITFAQRWFSGSSDVVRVGAIFGEKSTGSGSFGGGLSLYYQPAGDVDLSRGLTLTHQGRIGVGTSSPLEELHVIGDIIATGDITAFYSSDIRLKKDIEPISEPIKKLMEISGVTYKWNEEYLKDKEVDGYFVRETEVGVIAQEVEKVLPEVVATRENGYKAVRYEKLVALLIEAVKDQQKQIDELKARLEEN